MHVHRRIQIDCEEKPVWRCLTEPEFFPLWMNSFVDVTIDQNFRSCVGAQSDIRLRLGDKIVRYRSVVNEWNPKQRLAVQLTGGALAPGMTMDVAYELSPGDMMGTTTLDLDVLVPTRGLLMAFLSPIMRFMTSLSVKRDLAALARVAPTIPS